MISLDDLLHLGGEVHFTVIRGDITPEEEASILADDVDPELEERIISRQVIHNLVTNTGRAGIATLMASGTTRPTYFAVGTSAITPAVADTTLTGELTRKALSTSTTIATYFSRFAVTFTTGDFNNTVRGVALFTAAAGGDMWTEASANVLKNASSTLVCDWRINVLTP